MPVRTFSLAFLQSAPGSVGVLCSLILRFRKECLLMSEYVNVAFLNARNDLRLFLCDLKDASHLPWAFATLRWSLFSLEIPFGLPWLLMFPWFSCQAAQGLHWFSPWSFMGFFASLSRHFSTWPVYMPLLSFFQRQPSLSLNTCQALHINVFAYFILTPQAIAAPLPDPWEF